MASVRRARNLRWATVLVAVAALAATPALISAAPVPAVELSGQQVVTKALASADVPHQGLVEVDGRVGLPTLPFGAGATPLLDTTSQLRTWWSSDRSWRTDLLSASGQQTQFVLGGGVSDGGVAAAGDTTVTYDYERDSATTQTLTSAGTGLRLPRTTDLLPPTATRDVLGWIGPTDKVEALASQRIAGVVAAGATVIPTDPRTSVGHVDVWIDPTNGLPLLLNVYARGGSTLAFSSRFLDLSLTPPTANELSPAIAPTVTRNADRRRDLVSFLSQIGSQVFPPSLGDLPALSGVVVATGAAVYGEGYARVAVLRLPDRLVPDIRATVGVTGQPATVGGAEVAYLRGPLVQVALLVAKNGAGYLVAGSLSPAAMNAAVAAAAATLPAGAAP